MANLYCRKNAPPRIRRLRARTHSIVVLGAVLALSGCAPARDERIVQELGGVIVHSNVDGYYFTAALPHATDDTLAAIGRRDPLIGLDLSGSAISDHGLVHLSQSGPLHALLLADTEVTDRGLVHLATLTGLTRLVLANTNITDAGLRDIPQSVWWLDVRGTRITDNGLKTIAFRLREITYLDLRETAITDEGIRALVSSRGSFYTILLDGTAITDESVVLLCRHLELGRLSLRDTTVTDAAIDSLIWNANLTCVNLEGSHVTVSGFERLMSERPEITSFSPPTPEHILRY